MKRDFKGIWIPKDIWQNEKLSVMEKILYVEIESLDNGEGCFARNEHFGKFLGLSKNRCSALISSLIDKGFVTMELKYRDGSKEVERRLLFARRGIPKNGQPPTDHGRPPSENGLPPSENREDSNTKSIIQLNNTQEKEIVAYLNQRTGKQFRKGSNIQARLQEGYTMEDFKYVIDIKVHEWLHNEKMAKYLTPKTLFAEANFDRYLNQAPPKATLTDLVQNGTLDPVAFLKLGDGL